MAPHAVSAEPLDAVPGRIARVVDVFFDERWPWWPSLLRLGLLPGVARSNKAKLGRGARGVVAAALAARDVRDGRGRQQHQGAEFGGGHGAVSGRVMAAL